LTIQSSSLDGNYFAISGSASTAVIVSGSNSSISGSYFGFDPISGLLSSSPASVWIDVKSTNIQIGVSSANGSISERNIFAPVATAGFSIRVLSTFSCVIAGNLFGYDLNGSTLPPSTVVPSNGVGILVGAGGIAMIGTNADGVGDSNESNWFGCMSDSAIENRGSGTVISGNYFGFGTAHQFSSTQPSYCTPTTQYVRNTGTLTIGK